MLESEPEVVKKRRRCINFLKPILEIRENDFRNSSMNKTGARGAGKKRGDKKACRQKKRRGQEIG